MQVETIKASTYSIGASTLVLSLVMSGLMLAPNNASAFWWPWGDYHNKAHAQEPTETDDDEDVVITIQKYIDGEAATSETASGTAFMMNASWDDPETGTSSSSYELSADNSFSAMTSDLALGADYSTEEVVNDVVGMNCDADQQFTLAGYSTGDTMEAAAAADITTTAPSFTDLDSDQYVIVWNETCGDDEEEQEEDNSAGSITGEVTGGQTEVEPGALAVTSVDAQKTTATANGEFTDGWEYVFNITVPTNEPNFAMKFADWTQNEGSGIIPVADNMRISSAQASATSSIVLTGADIYSSPELTMTGDLDPEMDGLQVQVLVEVAVPEDTFNGTYSTEYAVRTLE